MSEVLTTQRLSLRFPRMADADAIVREVNDAEIARWLTQVPHPYTRQDAEDFITRQTSGKTFVICRDDDVIGCIGTSGEFGYWLGRSHWGQGIATEASVAVLDWHFCQTDDALLSGHAIGNERSRAVLVKLGFQDQDIVDRKHQITGAIRKQQMMTLSADAWRAKNG